VITTALDVRASSKLPDVNSSKHAVLKKIISL